MLSYCVSGIQQKSSKLKEFNDDPATTKYGVYFHDGFCTDVLGKDIRPMDPEKAKSVVSILMHATGRFRRNSVRYTRCRLLHSGFQRKTLVP